MVGILSRGGELNYSMFVEDGYTSMVKYQP